MRPTIALVVLCAAAARAQTVVPAVLDAQNLPDASVKKVQRAAEAVLKQLSAWSVGDGPAWKRGAPRRCGEDCARDVVKGIPAPAVVLLDLKADLKGERLAFEVSFWLDGARLGARRGEGTLEGVEAALRPPLEALLPPWGRKGFGGLRLEVEAGSSVKVDGRLVAAPSGDTVALPAGPHQVDVVFPDGHAVLQRIEVAEGSRGALEVPATTEFVSARAPAGTSALRATSYAVFMAGAAAIAGGLVAGALSRGTGADMNPCRLDTRDCATLDAALEANRQAQALATTGNVLIGAGAGLVAVGAGLFAIDAVAP